MRTFTTIRKGDIYSCTVGPSVFGGYDMRITRTRQGRDPVEVFTSHAWDMLSVKIKADGYLPGCTWTEKDPPMQGFAPVYYEDEKKYTGLLSEE